MKNNLYTATVIIFLIGLPLNSAYRIDNFPQKNISTFQYHSNLPEMDRGIAVIETRKGEILAIGMVKKNPQADGDILVVCLEGNGNIKWTQTYGGEGDDMGWDLLELPEGGFLLAGTSNSDNRGSRDMMAIKTDSGGREIWKKYFGTDREEYCWDMIATRDGNILLVGETSIEGPYGKGNKDFYVVKIDSRGKEAWSRTYGGDKTDRCYALDSTGDGFVLVGSTNSFGAGDQDVYLLKIDTRGQKQWSRTFGSEKFDMGHDVKYTLGRELVIFGYTQSQSRGENDAWIIKTDDRGNKIWETVIGEKEDDRVVRGIQTGDGNFMMTGYTKSYGASFWDLWLVKIDNKGKPIWKRNHSGIGADLGYGIAESKDGGILLTGQTYSFGNQSGDLWLLKTDSSGRILQQMDDKEVSSK